MKSRTLEEAEQIVEDLESYLRETTGQIPIEEKDAKIKPLIIGLVRWGIDTTLCCQGHSDEGLGYPWVRVTKESLDRINKILMHWTHREDKSSMKWIIEPAHQPKIRPEKEDLDLEAYHREIQALGKWLQSLSSNSSLKGKQGGG